MNRERFTVLLAVVTIGGAVWALMTGNRKTLRFVLSAAGAVFFGEEVLRSLGRLGD